jgi:hypothetical protein
MSGTSCLAKLRPVGYTGQKKRAWIFRGTARLIACPLYEGSKIFSEQTAYLEIDRFTICLEYTSSIKPSQAFF